MAEKQHGMKRFGMMSRAAALALLMSVMGAVLWSGGAQAAPGDDAYWGDAKHPIIGAQAARALAQVPDKLKPLIKGHAVSVYSIDLDRDGAPDFIVRYHAGFKTCFVKSDLSIMHCERLGYGDGFRYYWFVDLAGDSMLQLISLEGDEDYSDYHLYHFDRATWRMASWMRIAPVILSESPHYKGIYWGYPWDITALVTAPGKNGTRIRCLPTDKARDQLDEEAEDAMFVAFRGKPTQGEPSGFFNYLQGKFKAMGYQELKRYYQPVRP